MEKSEIISKLNEANPNVVAALSEIVAEEMEGLVKDMYTNFDAYFKYECVGGLSYLAIRDSLNPEAEEIFSQWKVEKLGEAYKSFLLKELEQFN